MLLRFNQRKPQPDPPPDTAERGSAYSTLSFSSNNVSVQAEYYEARLMVDSLTHRCDTYSTKKEYRYQAIYSRSKARNLIGSSYVQSNRWQ